MIRFIFALGLFAALTLPLEAAEKKTPPQAEAGYIKVEARGTLRITDKFQRISSPLDQQPFGAYLTTSEQGVPLFFGKDKELLAQARKLNGKTVVLTGKLRRDLEVTPPSDAPPQTEVYIHVTVLKPVGSR